MNPTNGKLKTGPTAEEQQRRQADNRVQAILDVLAHVNTHLMHNAFSHIILFQTALCKQHVFCFAKLPCSDYLNSRPQQQKV